LSQNSEFDRKIQKVDLLRSAQLRYHTSRSDVGDEHERQIHMLAMRLCTGEIAIAELVVKAVAVESTKGGCEVIGG
jgi:hypothetical protein